MKNPNVLLCLDKTYFDQLLILTAHTDLIDHSVDNNVHFDKHIDLNLKFFED